MSNLIRYRDTKTGRLVKKETWKRSKAQGGKRYKREIIKPKPKKKKPKTKRREYLLTFSYPRRKKHPGFKADVFCIGPISASMKRLIEICREHLDDGWFLDVATESQLSAGALTYENETAELRSYEKI